MTMMMIMIMIEMMMIMTSPDGECMLLVEEGVSHTLIIGDSGLISGSVLGSTSSELTESILPVSDMVRTWTHSESTSHCVTISPGSSLIY